MADDETCEVLPYGFIDGTLTPSDTLALCQTGAIPAEYVRERAQLTLGVAFLSGALASLFGVLIYYSGVLTHLL